ncbi:hypothetical protein CALCODRAFT_491403 [Calocera cornea HHB12733]|uniref:F-box domain-containing protein n=1 Tax=Calocera cornea HHB12733 TaxID=1353952 RepID=A0A165J2S8_9BASI|nr:hypothetical protein CALCODRAFT_491403 [Calocera cornea HHB12733]
MSGPEADRARVLRSRLSAPEDASSAAVSQCDPIPKPCFISQLPDELLSTVFERVVASYERSAVSLPSLYAFLRSATCVCRKWYRVAAQTPRLWRTLWTFGPECSLLLERSGAVPLHVVCNIEVLAAFFLGDLDQTGIEDRLEYLSVAARQDYNLYGSSPRDYYHIMNAIPRQIPTDSLRKLPSLTDVNLGPARLIEFGNLIVFSTYAHMLRRLRLRTITWSWYPQTTLPENRRHAQFQCLEELELINLSLANVEEMLFFSEMPKLARLLIIIGEDEGYKQLEHPIQRSFRGTSLVDLCLDTSHITLGDIIELLASLPTIEQLGLFRQPQSTYKQKFQELFHCLAQKQGATFPMLPNLKTLAHYDVLVGLEDLRLLVEAREHFEQPIVELGFKEIRTTWYLDKDFKWLKKRVKVFEWFPRYLAE